MNCTDTWAHAALDKLFVGDIDVGEVERLRKHAACCASCSEQYDRLSRADAKLSRAEVISSDRMALLQNAVLARVGAAEEAARAQTAKQRWWMPALGFALAAGIAAAIAYVPTDEPISQYQARGKSPVTVSNAAFGIRAFCVEPGTQTPKVLGEALPGQKLKCAHGSVLQITYSAPRSGELSIDVNGSLPLFPLGGGSTKVVSGVDVPLDFSTPVNAQWLSKPAEVKAKFKEGGQTVESVITVEP